MPAPQSLDEAWPHAADTALGETDRQENTMDVSW